MSNQTLDSEPSLTPPERPDLYREEKVFYCAMCMKEIPEEQSKFSLCKAHEEAAQKRFTKFMDTFSKEEREFLNWRYDGQSF